jgi:hypothetical protein
MKENKKQKKTSSSFVNPKFDNTVDVGMVLASVSYQRKKKKMKRKKTFERIV